MNGVPVGHGVVVPDAEIELSASRSGGPGGQGVNTTSSRIELRWDVSGSSALSGTQRQRLLERLAPRLTSDGVLVLHASEHRSQHRNRQAALARLAAIVGEALEPPRRRRRTTPTKASRRRRLENKRRRGEVKRMRRPPDPPG